jgi:hypothetical protein
MDSVRVGIGAGSDSGASTTAAGFGGGNSADQAARPVTANRPRQTNPIVPKIKGQQVTGSNSTGAGDEGGCDGADMTRSL